MNPARRTWTDDDADLLLRTLAPIQYLRGKIDAGRALHEEGLRRSLDAGVPSWELMWLVYNTKREPRTRYDVALIHFYRPLGRDLGAWERWPDFVNGFHRRLFTLAGISRDELLHDSRRMATFSQRLRRERDERATSGTTRGQRDLIEPRARVSEAHGRIARKIDEFHAESEAERRRIDARLRELFPNLI